MLKLTTKEIVLQEMYIGETKGFNSATNYNGNKKFYFRHELSICGRSPVFRNGGKGVVEFGCKFFTRKELQSILNYLKSGTIATEKGWVNKKTKKRVQWKLKEIHGDYIITATNKAYPKADFEQKQLPVKLKYGISKKGNQVVMSDGNYNLGSVEFVIEKLETIIIAYDWLN